MRARRLEFLRYGAVSGVALLVDMALFLSLAPVMDGGYMAAATIGFLAGSVVHYALAVRLVFRHRRLAHNTVAESVLYIVIGLVGLAVNDAVIYACVGWLQTPLLTAKLAAAAGSFLAGYAGRKLLLFGAAAGKVAG
ncbi:GtrA family protein [uncultured Castellaniella sp.]|uniref:GtrA family protein n=1 Tax=uncultured Castellaniella sp. TaxID=647907 RepID=UPI002628CB44|nr:GtrA family protein [uncultured Castellaniella sp.]